MKNLINSSFSVQFSYSVLFDSATPWTAAHQASLSITNSQSLLNSCPSSRWCHPTFSSSVVPFSCLKSFPASGSSPLSRLYAAGGRSIGASAAASVLPMKIQNRFALGLTGLIPLLSKGLSSLLQHHNFKASIVWHSAFFMVQLSHLCMSIGRKDLI